MADSGIYLELEKSVGEAMAAKAGMVVIGLPGMGVSHFLEILAKRKNIPLLHRPEKTDTEWMIFNPDFLTQLEAIDWTVDQYRRASIKQKIILAVNAPEVLYDPRVQSAHIVSRWYRKFWLRVRGRADLELLVSELGGKLMSAEFDLLEVKSFGVARLAKYFLLNKEKLELSPTVLWLEDDWRKLVDPFLSQMIKAKPEWLVEMGLRKPDGQWRSEFLAETVKMADDVLALDIVNEVGLVELGEETAMLLPFEAKVLEVMLMSGGVIDKEKIAEIRWGDGSYDKASDQAISKAMQRLEMKLKYHALESVSKVGYKLVRK